MRRTHVAAFSLIVAFGVFGSRSVAAQTPTRDAAKPAAVGTASITGAIVSDDADARPLRRVRVGVMTSDRQVSRTVVTDDEGRFNFVALPAGRYMLTANKQGYVSASYGARRPNRPGTALVLAEDQRITGLTLRMTRGSAISGVLVDQNGEPFSGANVSAMRNQFVGTGQRSLLPVGSAVSDDRGQYRLWGLAAGDYVISANAGFASQTRDNDIARLTDADIKRAMSEVAAGAARPGGPSEAGADPEVRPRTVGYAAVFYPGTPVAAQAMPIKLGAAEERTGVDFPMALVQTARVEGSISCPGRRESAERVRAVDQQRSSGVYLRHVQALGAGEGRDVLVRGSAARPVCGPRAGAAADEAHWTFCRASWPSPAVPLGTGRHRRRRAGHRGRVARASARPDDCGPDPIRRHERAALGSLADSHQHAPGAGAGRGQPGTGADPARRDRIVHDSRPGPRPVPPDGEHSVATARCQPLAVEVVRSARARDRRHADRSARQRRRRRHHVHRPRVGAFRASSRMPAVSRRPSITSCCSRATRPTGRQRRGDSARSARPPTASTRSRTCRRATT